ncbi:MAG: MFS transporter [Novosphingobium sp.]
MSTTKAVTPSEFAAPMELADRVERPKLYRRVALRLMPFILLCYIVNAIDRTNVSMAQLRLERDLGFTAEVFGLGLGLFYLGYVLLEVPSNILLARIGVRKTLLRIMGAWGVMSCATMFVTTPTQFYVVRFMLGLAEAGFYPGILLYITIWFPSGYRARITALFMMGSPAASAISSPLSGSIMVGMEGVGGLYGWQWMFLLEGFPAVLLGIAAMFVLTDRPEDAHWLSPAQKAAMADDFSVDEAAHSSSRRGGYCELLSDPPFYTLGFAILSTYALINSAYWTPLLLREAGMKSVANIGLMAAVPPLTTIVAMFFFARHSDKVRERRWHYFATLVAGATAVLLLATLPPSPTLVVVFQAIIMSCTYSSGTLLPGIFASFMAPAQRPAGMAILTSIGALGSVITPIAIGRMRVVTGSYSAALIALCAVVALAAVLFILAIPKDRFRERSADPAS